MNSAGLSENENVDDEWANFMLKFSGISVSGDRVGKETEIEKSKKSFDLYESDACPVLMDEIAQTNAKKSTEVSDHILKEAPKSSELHISTKTKVLYLNCPINFGVFL